MSTPAQWELGGAIIDGGVEHPSLQTVKTAWEDFLAALASAQEFSAKARQFGYGRTEDGTMIVARVVPALREMAETAAVIAKQLEERLGGP